MKTPVAWLNLVHQKKRTLVAVAGVAFAVLLVFTIVYVRLAMREREAGT